MSSKALTGNKFLAQLGKQTNRPGKDAIALGDAARDSRDWHSAAAHYQQALEKEPKNQPIWIQLGHALKESNRLADAEQAYRRATVLRPDDPEAYLQLGHCLKVGGDIRGAVAAYVESVRLSSDNVHAIHELRHLGWTKSEIDQIADDKAAVADAIDPENDQDNFDFAISMPDNYLAIFPDAAALIDMGLCDSAEQHFALYGRKQGRDILATFADNQPDTAIVLCPSFFKRCGIGEHSRYLADALENGGMVTHRIRKTSELARFDDNVLRNAIFIINHGPGLFDGYNPELSEGEATIDLLTTARCYFETHGLRPVIFMHSLLDRDNTVMFPRQQMALEFPIPVLTTIEAAAQTFNIPRVEHGMQPIQLPAPIAKARFARDYPSIGFFGFFQWGGKNFDALFNAARKVKAKLVGSVATSSADQVASLTDLIKERNIQCNLGTGWVEDSELAVRLNEADFYYLPQHDYDHWNNSGTARFVMNFEKPVVVPPHNPFLDLRGFAIFAEDDDLPQIISHLRDPESYAAACKRSADYGKHHSMNFEMTRMAQHPHVIASESGTANFLDANALCAVNLMRLSLTHFQARIRHFSHDLAEKMVSSPLTAERVREIRAVQNQFPAIFGNDWPSALTNQYWKEHYDVREFLFGSAIDGFYSAFRAIAKREPDLHDVVKYGSHFTAGDSSNAKTRFQNTLVVVEKLLDANHRLEFANPVTIFDGARALAKGAIATKALIDKICAEFEQARSLLTQDGQAETDLSPASSFFNIADILMMPRDQFANAVTVAAASAGITADLSRISNARDPMKRFYAIATALSASGHRITDIFVIDKPTINPVNCGRKVYGIGELWCREGDEFIFNAIQSLLKRAPLVCEHFHLENLLVSGGKAAVLQFLADQPECQATVVDLATYDEDQLNRDAGAIATLAQEMRSVHAGGWDQRNAYLEARRNASRLWLKTNELRKRFWSQSGQNQKIINSALSSFFA